MIDKSNGGGVFPVLLGTGLAAILLSPFYVAHRLGLHVVAALVAVVLTLVGVFSNSLVALGDGGFIGPLVLINAQLGAFMDGPGWWLVGVSWLVFVLSIAAGPILRRGTR